MLPQESFKFRPHESAFEAIRDHHNQVKTKKKGNWTVTQAIHCMVVSWSPFPLESAFVYEALPQNCLLGAADLCLQDMNSDLYRDVCCVRVATCSKHAVNLCD